MTSVSQIVKGFLHCSGERFVARNVGNGIESFWAIVKRGHKGVYHQWSKKHNDRYIAEFAGRQNMRNIDTFDQMGEVIADMEGKRLTYKQLIA